MSYDKIITLQEASDQIRINEQQLEDDVATLSDDGKVLYMKCIMQLRSMVSAQQKPITLALQRLHLEMSQYYINKRMEEVMVEGLEPQTETVH